MNDTDLQELAAEARHQRHQAQRLSAAPDCRDPDHPGCAHCMGDDDDDDDDPEYGEERE